MIYIRWNDWNREHVQAHGVNQEDVERVIGQARPPFPQKRGDGKWLVWGRGCGGRWLQVIFVLDEEGCIFPIHARPLTDREKRRLRRRSR